MYAVSFSGNFQRQQPRKMSHTNFPAAYIDFLPAQIICECVCVYTLISKCEPYLLQLIFCIRLNVTIACKRRFCFKMGLMEQMYGKQNAILHTFEFER